MSDDLDDIPRNPNHRLSHSPISPSFPLSTKILILTSYSHRRGPLLPPLVPTPGLAFDIRTLPNPPKRVRDVYVGTDKPMRKAFMEGEGVRERVEGIWRAVRVVLEQTPNTAAGGDVPMGDATKEPEHDPDSDSEEEEEEDEEEEMEKRIRVCVGICCEVGRHRSVACVEELARMVWPQGWEIEVVHRDLTRPRSERDKEKRSRKVARGEEED
ncbi:hypothetical protein DXG01_010244 [Tephrocybe rancida]|nr:hypothetical protein DXG01_010244 [Tephrocybe rancida]